MVRSVRNKFRNIAKRLTRVSAHRLGVPSESGGRSVDLFTDKVLLSDLLTSDTMVPLYRYLLGNVCSKPFDSHGITDHDTIKSVVVDTRNRAFCSQNMPARHSRQHSLDAQLTEVVDVLRIDRVGTHRLTEAL